MPKKKITKLVNLNNWEEVPYMGGGTILVGKGMIARLKKIVPNGCKLIKK